MPNVDGSDAIHVFGGVSAALGRAKSRGGPELPKLAAAVDDFKRLSIAADANKDGQLTEQEQKKLKTTGEKNFIQFVVWAKSKKLSQLDLPPKVQYEKPKFKWTGTPKEVAQSLLLSTSNPSNDDYWPAWNPDLKGASRYVITQPEARAMVEALKPLYPARQRAVLTALAERSQSSEFGCVAPSAAAKSILENHAASLGLAVEFGQPQPPSLPVG